MNERIKELAEQAGFHFYDMHDVDGQDLGETIEADDWSAVQKFAESIVRECAHIGFNAAYPKVGVEVLLAIKQHFGIK